MSNTTEADETEAPNKPETADQPPRPRRRGRPRKLPVPRGVLPIPPAQRSTYPGPTAVPNAMPEPPPGGMREAHQIRGPPDRFLRVEDVIAITSLSRSEIYRRIELNEFPPGIKLGAAQSSRVVWIESEVVNWMHDRIAEWRERMPT